MGMCSHCPATLQLFKPHIIHVEEGICSRHWDPPQQRFICSAAMGWDPQGRSYGGLGFNSNIWAGYIIISTLSAKKWILSNLSNVLNVLISPRKSLFLVQVVYISYVAFTQRDFLSVGTSVKRLHEMTKPRFRYLRCSSEKHSTFAFLSFWKKILLFPPSHQMLSIILKYTTQNSFWFSQVTLHMSK